MSYEELYRLERELRQFHQPLQKGGEAGYDEQANNRDSFRNNAKEANSRFAKLLRSFVQMLKKPNLN